MAMQFRWLGVIVLLVGLLAGCSAGTTPAASQSPAASPSAAVDPSMSPAPPAELTIYAAASLRDVLDALQGAYESANPGTSLVISTGASSALSTQIEQGAPGDVFLSADTANPERLVEGGYAAGDAAVFAGNLLIIITPPDDPGGVETPADLGKDGLRIIAAGEEVPITKYATQLVQNLAALPGYPADFEAAYAANIATREESVADVVTKVAAPVAEGDAGIVYVTDATSAGANVSTVAVPEEANVPATYAGIVLESSRQPEAAQAFLDWVVGPEGQAILESFRFLPASA
jgi:molybdate transport system substrate-binding protein